jgi:hypothetical protein
VFFDGRYVSVVREMSTNASPYIVNIVPLQNLASDIRGTSDLTILQGQVADIQRMVDTTNFAVYTNSLSNVTSGAAIEVYADLNLSNANIYSNSNLVTLNTALSSTALSSTATTTTQSGTSSTNAGGSTIVTFLSNFSNLPTVSLTFLGRSPVFMTCDTVSISSFSAYSWSNNAIYGGAPFSWSGI